MQIDRHDRDSIYRFEYINGWTQIHPPSRRFIDTQIERKTVALRRLQLVSILMTHLMDVDPLMRATHCRSPSTHLATQRSTLTVALKPRMAKMTTLA